MERHFSGWSLLSKFFGLIIFLVVVLGLNLLTGTVQSPLFSQIVNFLNANVLVITLVTLFFIVADLFWSLASPFDLAYPLFEALGIVFVLTFFLRLVVFLAEVLTSTNIQGLVNSASYVLYPLVFIIAIVAGYMNVASGTEHHHHPVHHHHHGRHYHHHHHD